MIDLVELTRNIVGEFLENTQIKVKLCVGDIVVKSFIVDYEDEQMVLIDENEYKK